MVKLRYDISSRKRDSCYSAGLHARSNCYVSTLLNLIPQWGCPVFLIWSSSAHLSERLVYWVQSSFPFIRSCLYITASWLHPESDRLTQVPLYHHAAFKTTIMSEVGVTFLPSFDAHILQCVIEAIIRIFVI